MEAFCLKLLLKIGKILVQGGISFCFPFFFFFVLPIDTHSIRCVLSCTCYAFKHVLLFIENDNRSYSTPNM